MFAVPSSGAHASTVPALPVLGTSVVARQLVAFVARPPDVAFAFALIAFAVQTAVQVTQRYKHNNQPRVLWDFQNYNFVRVVTIETPKSVHTCFNQFPQTRFVTTGFD